jgi:predicted class III extradiol MEMO1 family dioxygenase
MDKEGISLIESHDAVGFNKYLESTENTICGRHPIGVLMHIINNSTLKQKLKTKFVSYN